MSGSAGKRPSVGMDVSLAKRKTSNYRDIPASDIVSRFGKEKLIEKCEILIHRNVARLPLLEARNLINSACRNSIEAKLNHGQSSSAAIELVEYFEVNHDGVRMEEFCVFVENQAGKSSNQLLKFAEELRDCIIQLALASHGSSEHTDECETSPSQLKTSEAKVKANPNPFLPPEFPPTGSSAAQGPPSQLLLGPSPGMPLPMPPQAPGTFPPGMGVPSGFKSQPMSVSQPLWGIPPTSTVSLAPSVSTEQANPNPFLPPQFPPTGSSAARGPPSQLLLGPPPRMPLPIPSQVPGAFPQGMGVPPGFESQPMSVSQPFWGIPPTSTVSLAPSVSTEQDLIRSGREGKDTQTPAEEEMQCQRNNSDQVSDALAVWGSKQKERTVGIAFVLTNGDEKDEDHLTGVLQDNHRWFEALTKLTFDVRSEHNVQEERMKKYLEAVAKVKLLPECKFVIFVFSGHGAEGILYSCDDKPIVLSEYLPNFFKGELGRINKLFFFDACRDGNEGRYFMLGEALFESKPKESTGGYLAFCAVPINAEADDDPKGSLFSTIVTELIVGDRSLADVVAKTHKKIKEAPHLDCLTGGLSAASVNLRKLADQIGHGPSENTDESGPSPSQLKTNEAKVKVSSDVGNVCEAEDLGALAHEAELEKLCWIPFGIQTLTAGEEGGLFPLQPQTTEVYKDNDVIALEVPEGAVNTAVCDRLCIRYGVIVFGPFDLPEGYQLGSMAVYIYFNQEHAVKPVVLHLPHWSGKDGESGLKCVVAPHRLEEGEEKYKFKDVEEGDFQSREGRRFITIEGHCSVFAKAFEDGFGANYLATSLIQKSEKDLRAVTNITVTYSSPVWIEIFMKFRKGFKVDIQRLFSFESEDAGVKMKLVEAQGPGWEAIVSGHLLPKDIQYETYKIKSPKQLKQAVINELYPPCLTCKATSSREAKESGKHKDVKVILEGTDRSTDCMVFTCPAFEERLTERDAPIGMNSPPHLVLSAPKHMTGPAFFVDGTPSVSPTSSGPQSLLTNRPSKELRVQHLMPYLTDLAACGLGIAGYLGLSTVWASIEISLKDPPGRLQELLTKWLDDSEQETSPHTWEFFVDVVRKVGKGKLADRIVHEIFTEPQDSSQSSVGIGLDKSPQTEPSQTSTAVEENGH